MAIPHMALKIDEKDLIQNCRACRSWQAEHVFSLHLTSISYSFGNKGQKVLTFFLIWWKKSNNFKMGIQIYFQIAG